MIITESHVDLPTSTTPMRVFLFAPNVPQHPHARFPAVIVHSEIYQVTGPVARLARQIASHGYICAAPSSYHEFTSPDPIAYDGPGTDAGNAWKIEKKLAAYDEDSRVVLDYLTRAPNCTGKIGATGMCLGGHLALRTAFDPRVRATYCFFATDIHKRSLGAGMSDDSLDRMGEIKGEIVMVHGTADPHVPREGRDLIRKTLADRGVKASFLEIYGANHAFIRDELSKGRYDAAVTGYCFQMMLEVFDRELKLDLGPAVGEVPAAEDVC